MVFFHGLEHLGRDPRVFLAMFQELYRVCRKDAVVRIVVPHPRHDHFLNDPTHVRAITPGLLALFSRKENDRWRKNGAANTPLAHQLGVDFELVSHEAEFEEPYRTRIREGSLGEEAWKRALRERNNIATEYRIELRVKKESDAPAASPCATAFLFEPGGSEADWIVVLRAYLESYAPGAPVALVIPLGPEDSPVEIQGRILRVAADSGRDAFPDIVLVGHDENVAEILRSYASIHRLSGDRADSSRLPPEFGQRLAGLRKPSTPR